MSRRRGSVAQAAGVAATAQQDAAEAAKGAALAARAATQSAGCTIRHGLFGTDFWMPAHSIRLRQGQRTALEA
ncbi:hypothetical protein [Streptomyces sp. NPDC052036]|uniref:hypothetical protein n=1 Tax=Streptomyces sp. NPDC052036 TaxID=3155171 RepID=UPI003433E1E8